MRTLSKTAGSIMAALCLTACEATGPSDGDGGSGKEAKSAPVIAVAPARLTFRIYAFAPQRDPQAQTLSVNRVGSGTLVWNARTTAGWMTLGHAAGAAPGQVEVELNRAGMHLGVNGYRPHGLTGTITVSAGGSTTPVQIPVSVMISYLPPIKIFPGGDPGIGPKSN